jgi:hypothetical protein
MLLLRNRECIALHDADGTQPCRAAVSGNTNFAPLFTQQLCEMAGDRVHYDRLYFGKVRLTERVERILVRRHDAADDGMRGPGLSMPPCERMQPPSRVLKAASPSNL